MSKDVWLLENALMQAALQAAGIGLIIVDASGRIVAVNDLICRGLRTGRLDLLGQPFQLLLRPEVSLPKFREVFHVDQPPIRTEGRLDAQGLAHVLLFNATTYEGAGGERYRSVSIVDAMSFGASYDQATAMRDHLQAMNTSVVAIDSSRPDYPLLKVNATFERILGHRARDAIGTPFLGLLRPPGAASPVSPEIETQLVEAIVQGRTLRLVLPVHARDGRCMEVDWRQTPLFDAHGNTTQVFATMRPMAELVGATPRSRPAHTLMSDAQADA